MIQRGQELRIGRKDFLKIIAISGLILTMICVVLVFQQLYLFKREFQSLDDDQVLNSNIKIIDVTYANWGRLLDV